MTRDLWTATIMVLALVLLTLTAVAGDVPAIPPGPPDHDRTEACGGGAVSYLHVWDLASGDQLMVYGQMLNRTEHGPVLVRYMTPAGEEIMRPETQVWLSLPDHPVEALTLAALTARYPQPCDLIRSVVGTGGPKTDL